MRYDGTQVFRESFLPPSQPPTIQPPAKSARWFFHSHLLKERLRWEPNTSLSGERKKSHENKLNPTTSVYTSQYLHFLPSAIHTLYAYFQSLYRSQRMDRERRHNNDCKSIPSGVSSRALGKGRKMAAGKRWTRRAEKGRKSANYS